MASNSVTLNSANRLSVADRLWRAVLYRMFGSGWPAALGHRLGFQRSVVCHQHQVTLAEHLADEYSAGGRDLRIAFAADFHAGPTTHPRVLGQACEALAAAQADVLLLGGDFVSLRADYIDHLVELLAEIPAPLGKFAVLGNHDIWADRDYVTAALRRAGVQVLVNRNVRLPAPYEHVWICGLDDHLLGRPDAAAALHGADGTRIVLMHSPSGLVDLGDADFDLALCGHTHGGQIALRGGRPIVMPRGPLCRKYAAGRFELNRNGTGVMLVSRGIGCSTLPVRLWCHPEVMVCRLMGAVAPQMPAPAAATLSAEAWQFPDAQLPDSQFPDSLGVGAV